MQLQQTLSGLVSSIASHQLNDLAGIEREKVLIVDDSPVVRRSLTKALGDAYQFTEASTVLEAFELLRSTEFSLVITDIIMPGLSGIELLRKVIEVYPRTSVIVVSGVDRPQRALDAVRLGAFDYLIKPFDNEVLALTVTRALEHRSLLINAKQYKADLEARNEELIRGKQQLQRLQAQIVQNEKMASIGQLAAGIAHELNNPVGFLYGNLDLLSACVSDLTRVVRFYEHVELPADVAQAASSFKEQIGYERTVSDLDSIIADCREGAERVRDIVQNLRTFSRLDEAELKRTDIHEGIESTLRILSRYFSGGAIELVRDFGELPTIEAYSAKLNQVWMNLLVNAAQAVGSNQGSVTISTRSMGDKVYVAVSDTGSGIDPAVAGRIFDPFFTTKPVGEGTGLGLSISFGIIEDHGGTIKVQSKQGVGTTFTVELLQRLPQKNDANSDSHTQLEVQHAFSL
ncbi:MAG: response regulator [bacterium]|nr:response regulator [bacterium]